MLRSLDFGTWQGIASAVLGIALFALIGIGLRILVMVTLQQRRERLNRQINERLKVLIAAYKVLGGSFSGKLIVDPRHLRDLRTAGEDDAGDPVTDGIGAGSDRARRIRDAVEGALADVLLLGTEDQVRLAERAARDLAEGRPVEVRELVVALRDFIRQALDLAPIPADLAIPSQGPTRPGPGGGGRTRGDGARAGRGGAQAGGSGGTAIGLGLAGGGEPPPPG